MSLGSALSGFYGGQISGSGSPLVTQDLTSPINDAQVAQSGNIANQQSLGKTLLDRSNGGGPSAADALLTQGQGQAAAQASGVYSGNRAINAGLAARQAANIQGNLAQQASNQGAQLKAQEQQAATGQLQNLYGQVGQQSLTGEGIYQQALANQNSAINQGNAIAAGVNENNANNAQSAAGGLIQGIAGVGAAFAGLAKGGVVRPIPHYDYGGLVAPMPIPMNSQIYMPSAPTSAAPMNMSGMSSLANALKSNPGKDYAKTANGLIDQTSESMDATGKNLMTNDVQPMQAGLGVAAPSAVAAPGLGVDASSLSADPGLAAALFKMGGKVGGKAKVKGDSYSNDTVPAVLSPGEVVLPRHVTGAKNAPESAKKFVQALMDKESEKKQKYAKGGRVTPGQGISAILQAQASLHERMKKLEKKGK